MSRIETIITNRRADVARVSRLVDELGANHGLPLGVVADMNVALDEVLTNIIQHGYSDDRIHEIRIRLTVDNDVLEAVIEDDGKPFNPLATPPPTNLAASLRERPVGGLGIYFVKRLMSEVAYARVENRNCLMLKKRLMDRREADSRGPA